MQTSNYLPYALDKGFSRLRNRGPHTIRFYKQRAHKRERQAIREWLHNDRGREPSKYKWWVTGWDLD